jgi:hypothetical protein
VDGDKLQQQTELPAASGHNPRSVANMNLHHLVRSVLGFHVIAYVYGSLFNASVSA